MTDAATLVNLAKELKLTEPQRVFAEGLAAGKTQRQAAIDAGSKDPDSRASKWTTLDKVQKYLKALTIAAVANVEKRTKRKVATLGDALLVTSDIMRGRLGRFITESGDVDLERVRKAPSGVVKRFEVKTRSITTQDGPEILERTTQFELASSLAAAAKLIDYYEPKKDAPAVNLNMVVLPPEMATALFRQRMKGQIGEAR